MERSPQNPPSNSLSRRAPDQSVSKPDPRLPAVRADGSVMRSLPTYAPGELEVVSGNRLRDECWRALGDSVRNRMLDRAGQIIGWWAIDRDDYGRPEAVVFGDRGMCFADPRVNSEHRPVYAISTYVLDPASFKHVDLEHRPPKGESRKGGVGRQDSAPGPPSTLGPDLGRYGRDLLGNLPPRAQELLQAPFASGQPFARFDYYYQAYNAGNDLPVFVVVFAGKHEVTAAVGSRVVPVGHTAADAHWSLRCYRAAVVRRIGG